MPHVVEAAISILPTGKDRPVIRRLVAIAISAALSRCHIFKRGQQVHQPQVHRCMSMPALHGQLQLFVMLADTQQSFVAGWQWGIRCSIGAGRGDHAHTEPQDYLATSKGRTTAI